MTGAVLAGLILAGMLRPLGTQKPQEAEAMVRRAIEQVKVQGAARTLKAISTPGGPFHRGALYVFVYDVKGTVLAHGLDPGLVGKDLSDARDADGWAYVKERIVMVQAKGKGWQEYKQLNPVTRQVEAKTAYVELFEGMIFGCGIYR